jgi:hypothetical protein
MTKQTPAHRIRRPAAYAVLVALVVALLALTAAGPALAHPAAKAKMRPFACKAVVTSTDATGMTLTAKVTKATRPVKRLVGSDVAFTVSERTVMLKAGGKPPLKLALADFATGDRVLVVGRVDRSNPDAPVFKARLIVLLRAAAAAQS